MKSKSMSMRQELRELAPLFIVSGLLFCCVFVAMQFRDELAPIAQVEVTHAP